MTKPDSYPFLKIARMFGVDYGDVLLVADRWRGYIGNPHWIAADRRLYYQLTPENNMALSFAIEAANAEFKRIQAGEIDWQTGAVTGTVTAHFDSPELYKEYKKGEPLGARNYQLFDASLDAGTNDMSNTPKADDLMSRDEIRAYLVAEHNEARPENVPRYGGTLRDFQAQGRALRPVPAGVEIKHVRLEDMKPVCKYCGQDHSTIHPNGAKMFADDCTMLDDKGNRSIFDDVDEGYEPGEHQEVIDALNYRNSDDE